MSISSSGQQFDPQSLINQQQLNVDDQKTVTTGPGGSTGAPVVTIGDMITRFVGPSNQGLTDPSKDFKVSGDINAADPTLSFPTTGPNSFDMSALTHLMNQFNSQDAGAGQDIDASFGFDIGGAELFEVDVEGGLEMAVPKDLASDNTETVASALLAFTGIESDPGLSASQKMAFKEHITQIAGQIADKNAAGEAIPELASGSPTEVSKYLTSLLSAGNIPAEDLSILSSKLDAAASRITGSQFTSGLSSTDPQEVLSSLQTFIAINDNTKNTELLDKLKEMATNIAAQNASGGPNSALSTFDDKALSAYLLTNVDISSLSQENQTAFVSAVNDGAEGLSAINAASGQPLAKSGMLQAMESTDPAVVLAQLQSMVPPADAASLAADLEALAATIAARNASPEGAGLDITDAASLKLALVGLLSASQATNAKLLTALDGIAKTLAAENTSYFTTLSRSTDALVVFNALRHLSNIDHNPNLTPAERTAGLNYLKLMAAALSFMSTIRAKISMLEAQLRKAENEGKIATIRDQSKAAADTYTSSLAKIESDTKKMMDGLAMKDLMKVLGPIIMIIIAIIMAIITIFSFGSAAPVAATIMVVVIVVMTVIAIADMQTGMFDKAGKACSKDPAGQKAASFGFQAIIFAIMIVFSFGMASFAVAAQMAAQQAIRAGVEVMKEIVKEVIKQMTTQLIKEAGKEVVKQIMEMGMKQVVMFVVGELLSLLMSSGLLTEGFVKMFKAMGMSEKDAEMASMILTIVVMIVMMAVMAKCAGGIGKMAGGAAKTAVKEGVEIATDQAEIVIEQSVKETTKKVAKAAEEAADVAADTAVSVVKNTVDDSLDTMLESVIKNLNKKLSDMVEIVKDPQALLRLMQALAFLGEVGQGVAGAVHEFKQADLIKAQAKLEESQSHTQALIDVLKQLMPTFDMTLQDIDNDAKDFFKGYTELMNLFASFIEDASKISTETARTS